MQFSKYQALGNDYLVFASSNFDRELTPEEIRKICRPHTGVGADGLLWTTIEPENRRFEVRIFNPDGSEAAMSGNGVRIFARSLWDAGYVNDEPVEILTPSGASKATVEFHGGSVSLALAKPSFSSADIPVSGPVRDVIEEEIRANGRDYRFTGVTVGNPHCVIVLPKVSSEETRIAGPALERDRRFPARTNVQFVQIIDRSRIRLEIWERGAGYTLSSGTSAAAAAATVHRLGLAGPKLSVDMPGGSLTAAIHDDGAITIAGRVVKICQGTLSAEFLLQGE